jgi:hypothetical protein
MSFISKERLPIVVIVVGVVAIIIGLLIRHSGKNQAIKDGKEKDYHMSTSAKIFLYGGIILAIIGAVLFFMKYRAAKEAAASPASEAEFYDF